MKFTIPKFGAITGQMKQSRPFNVGRTSLAVMPINPKNMTKSTRKRVVRWGIVSGNFLLLLLIAIFVLSNRSASQTIRSGTLNNAVTTASSITNPLDQLSSDQIALQAAQMTGLPELTMVRNRADSAAAQLSVVPNDSTTLAKPQIVATAEKSRYDIIHYKVQANDTLDSLASKFNLNANSIRWSNGLSNSLTVGADLLIPPGDGIVYTVKQGETVNSINSKYQSNQDTFTTVNDAEGGVVAGEVVWIPNGIQPVVVPVFTPRLSTGSITGGFYYSGGCLFNGYDCGWCTWWAAYRRSQIGRPVPQFMGDAYSWASLAPSHGLGVGTTPQAGAVIWFPGANHVGFVESVSDDGSAYISEMHVNGYNQVTYRTIPGDSVGSYKYIY